MSLVSPVSFVRNKAECGVELQMKVHEYFTITKKAPTRLKVSMLKTKPPSLMIFASVSQCNVRSTYHGLMPV